MTGLLDMTFEGDFYDVMNGNAGRYGYKIQEDFEKLLHKYGLYYELGHSWSLSCVEE